MSDTKDLGRCSESVSGEGQWGSFHPHQCNNKGKVVREGKVYCTIHDPVRIELKAQQASEKWNREMTIRQEKFDRERFSVKYCEYMSVDKLRERVEKGFHADEQNSNSN